MTSFSFDTSELVTLEADLGQVPGKVNRSVEDAVETTGKAVERRWRNNARDTAGRAGKHYHKAIEVEADGYLSRVIGPNSGMLQGGMSFEYGSRKQPPHLDGNRAADVELPLFYGRVSKAVDIDL